MNLRLGLVGSFGGIALVAFAACVSDDPSSGDDTTADGGTNGDGALADGQVPDSGCGDLTSSNDNCGACGNVCDAGGCFESVCSGHSVISLSAGNGTACALLASGHVACWGVGDFGQLGVDPTTLGMLGGSPARSTAAEVPGITTATQLSVGKASSCVVVQGGDVYCWGRNESDGLAHVPGTAGDGVCAGVACNWTPSKVAGIPSPAAEVAVGERNACARTADGKLYCWGWDAWLNLGQGNGSDGGAQPTPVNVPGLTSDLLSVAVAINAGHVCGASGSALDCWGANLAGEIGHTPIDGGTPEDVIAPSGGGYANGVPQIVTLGSGVFPAKVIAAQGSTCLLDTTHAVHCMGSNANGDLGNGTAPSATPTAALTTVDFPNVTTVASNGLSGHGPTCVINESGAASCWGSAGSGQMGNGYWSGADAGAFPGIVATGGSLGACYDAPTPVPAMSLKTMAAGTGFVVALSTDGHVYGWGSNVFGQTGHDPATLDDQACAETGLPGECAPLPVRIMSLP